MQDYPGAEGRASSGAEARDVVLLAEPDPAVRRALTRALDRFGFDTLAAATAEDALRLLEGAAPRAVLVDADLYEPSGARLAAAIRARRPDLRLAVLAAGLDDRVAGPVFRKPFDLTALLGWLAGHEAGRDPA